jgi:hypothetical protein
MMHRKSSAYLVAWLARGKRAFETKKNRVNSNGFYVQGIVWSTRLGSSPVLTSMHWETSPTKRAEAAANMFHSKIVTVI